MTGTFTAVPTPIAPTYAAREATRLMPAMLRQLTNHRHCASEHNRRVRPCPDLAAAVTIKHTILDLIERAEGRS
jgi:hypothetical protein